MAYYKWGHDFDAFSSDPSHLIGEAGVYVIWCRAGAEWRALDVGESDNVKESVEGHKRALCWRENCGGTLYYSAKYTGIMGVARREGIVAEIRKHENPVCGAGDDAAKGKAPRRGGEAEK